MAKLFSEIIISKPNQTPHPNLTLVHHYYNQYCMLGKRREVYHNIDGNTLKATVWKLSYNKTNTVKDESELTDDSSFSN